MEIETAVAAPRVGAGRAVAIFVLYNVAQLLVGLAGLVAATIIAVARHVEPMAAVKELDVLLLVPTFVAGMMILYVLLRNWTPEWWREQRTNRFGLAQLSARRIAIAAACGVVLAAAFIAVSTWFPPADLSQIGPLSQLAHRGGIARATVVLMAILLAPPAEEVLFRGVLLDGFTESWGFVPAAVVVTLLFVAVHVFDIYRYWPGAAAVLALAIGALIVRRRMGSIAAAMIVHAVYNAGVSLREYLS